MNVTLGIQKEDKRKALYAALIFLMLLILFFLLYNIQVPDPPLEEKVVEVELTFGSEPVGGSSSEAVATPVPENTNTEETSREYDTQEESPVQVNSGHSTNTQETNNTQETQQQVDNTFTFGGNGGTTSGNGSGTGFGDGSGVGGNGSGNTAGDGNGSTNLNRKRLSNGSKPTAESQEEGKIVLDLWVDDQGNVVKTKYNESKSTSGSDFLIKLAKQWAVTMKYEKKLGAPDEYVGAVAFDFKKQ